VVPKDFEIKRFDLGNEDYIKSIIIQPMILHKKVMNSPLIKLFCAPNDKFDKLNL
jgi:hypothetical protein